MHKLHYCKAKEKEQLATQKGRYFRINRVRLVA